MNNKKIGIILLVIIILASVIFIWLKLKPFSISDNALEPQINNNEIQKSTSSEKIIPTNLKSDLIDINNIISGQLVQSPLIITGEARGSWFFEASFPIKIYDSNGQLLGTAIAQATSDWMTDKMVPFKAEMKFNQSTTTNGVIIFQKDNPSGLPENDDQLSLPIMFSPLSEKSRVKVYFLNDLMDPEVSCNKVFPVEREIIKTPAIARAALEELLKGASLEERQKGYISSINDDVNIQSLNIEDGIARVDFNEQLEKGVGGSCRVLAIRSQIVETLKQFATVNNVVISINGRVEDILQP